MLKPSAAFLFLVLVSAASAAPAAVLPVRETATRGQAVEMHLPVEQSFTPWMHDPAAFAVAQGDRLEMRQVIEPDVKTIKLENVVPPIHFRLGEAEIPEDYLERLRDILKSMRDRSNVRLHFAGHTDTLRLSPALQERYGDNTGLSRERAGTTAEYFQNALGLPAEAISYAGFGESQPIANNATDEGRQLNRRVEVQVWYDEIGEKLVEKEVVVAQEVNRLKVCRTETVCKLRYQEGLAQRAQVKNLIAPLHYDQGMVTVPPEFLHQIRQALQNLSAKEHVVVRFIAHTDNSPLQGRDERIYGDHLGLSKAVARRVSLAVQEGLGLTNAAIESSGKGAAQPATANATTAGRALNRRIEVEFWHDDALQNLPEEPQLCPDAPATEIVTRVYDSPSGPIAPILFSDGQPVLPAGYSERLQQIMAEISDRRQVRLRFVGYTRTERLDRRTAAVYGDDIGLSTARARRAMAAVVEQTGLTGAQVEFEGHGYLQSADVVNTGFIESDTSRVEVQVVFDEAVVVDAYAGIEITRLNREVTPANPFGLNLLRITVDGKPLDDPGKSVPDVQRCIDVALDAAEIQFKYDNLKLEPRLNVTAWPRSIRYQDEEATDAAENLVRFHLYSNYRSFIARAEVRIFADAQSVRDLPLAVVAMDAEGLAQWQADFASYVAPGRTLNYLVRVYDAQGNFDETETQPLWVLDQVDPGPTATDPGRELLAGYGESRIARRNIPLQGGSVLAQGTAIPSGYSVWLAGHLVPVDPQGRFIAEEILPTGSHSVEVAVLDPAGNGELFLRDFAQKQNDWFYVGIADVTLSANQTNGPAHLLAPDRPQYNEDFSAQGRLAFYTTGKFGAGWGLTASADTLDGPLGDIFSNFLDKSPDALLRRIDPEDSMPTYGDDSTVTEDAPTMGKFYARLTKDKNFGLWGNFKVDYTDNTLAQVDRGLYGANLHYQPQGTTSFGEARLLLDGFAAEPGTVGGRDEFRGTSGSLYFLRQQDLLTGSERLRIEIRDKDSGLVLSVKNLTPVLDYDIDYLQGRVLLAEPLSGTADDNLLVQSESFSGHPVFLVARYEYTPGFEDLDTLATGGRVHYWFNDRVKVGLTASRFEEDDRDSTLQAADLTLRKSSDSWLKVESSRSEGPGQLAATSVDGGYLFVTPDPLDVTTAAALATRVDASLGLHDFFANAKGRFTLYWQDLDAGYAAPGLSTNRDTSNYGGTAELPVSDRFGLRLKSDTRLQRDALETAANEVNLDFRRDAHWTLSSGLRYDHRKDQSPVPVPTQEEGDRTDMVVQLLYDSQARWNSYGFVQETLASSGNRDKNFRVGSGGSYRLTNRFKVNGEVSTGDLGENGRVGTEYLYSDRTNLYLNYALENERTDTGLRAHKGDMTYGFRSRYSDSASVYIEERYTHGDTPTGLMHSAGVDLAPTDRINLGAKLDFGTLKDFQTGAEIKRTAVGVSAGYGFDRLQLASAVEYRVDDSEHLGTDLADSYIVTNSKRTTWLLKNSLNYQLSPDWRLIGKLNLSRSDSSLGELYEGNYSEAVMGYAYRPVRHDRLNALLKYTYFYNVPGIAAIAVQTPEGTLFESSSLSGILQRSHIVAADVIYDLTSRWTVGAKYAYRQGEVSLDPVDREFFTSRAHLTVLRADWEFLPNWEALVEARQLYLPDAQDRLDGALLGLYRHVGDHFKFGAGYNFSNFSDDLTSFDYSHQGLFINIIGKM